MTDEHRVDTELAGNGVDVVGVVGNRTGIERLGQAAGPVAAKAQCDGAVAPVGEVAEEMLVPAPCCATRTVNEQQRHGMRFAG